MQRDMNLIRDLLLFYESDCAIPKPAADGTTVDEHTIMLIDAGLVFGTLGAGCENGGINYFPLDGRTVAIPGAQQMMFPLTWAGHEFLAAARDNKMWNRAAAAVGGMTFEIIKEYLKTLLLQKIGMGPDKSA